MVMVLFMCYLMTEVLRVSSSTWLSNWTDQGTSKRHGPLYYNLIYSFLSIGQVSISWMKLSYISSIDIPFYAFFR